MDFRLLCSPMSSLTRVEFSSDMAGSGCSSQICILLTSYVCRGLGDRRGITVSAISSRHLSFFSALLRLSFNSCPFCDATLPSPSQSSSLSLSSVRFVCPSPNTSRQWYTIELLEASFS